MRKISSKSLKIKNLVIWKTIKIFLESDSFEWMNNEKINVN